MQDKLSGALCLGIQATRQEIEVPDFPDGRANMTNIHRLVVVVVGIYAL